MRYFFLVLVLLGCQKHDRGTVTPAPENEPEENRAELKVEAVGLEEPGQYRVNLDWSTVSRPSSGIWTLKRNDRSEITPLRNDQTNYSDSQVESGKTYSYTLTLLGTDSPFQVTAKVKIPKDYILGKDMLEDVSGFGRVFILDRVDLGERSLKVETTELISRNGSIETFHSEETAPMGMAGKSGGVISIQAQKASGTLSVLAGGQNGGNGQAGENGADGAPGMGGTPGRVVSLTFNADHIPTYQQFQCTPAAGIGGNGTPGGNGLTGSAGGNGGNSSVVTIDILDADGFELKFSNPAGSGGIGGAGGRAGKGGALGLGGRPQGPLGCPADVADRAQAVPGCYGPDGQPGADGHPGQAGPNGQKGFQNPYCLKLGNKRQGTCDLF